MRRVQKSACCTQRNRCTLPIEVVAVKECTAHHGACPDVFLLMFTGPRYMMAATFEAHTQREQIATAA